MTEQVAIISRAEAKAAGRKRYFTGIPCPYGHIMERQVSWGRCVGCNRARVARKGRTPEGRANQLLRHKKWQRSEKGRVSKRKSNVQQYAVRSEEYKANSRARRARKYEAEGSHTLSDIREIRSQTHFCLCGADFKIVKPTVDHIVPLSRGGSDWASNLQLLCGPCNDSKGSKLMCEWVIPNRRMAA